ncbi:MAG: alpha/beta fold hydrolase [bacterium]
MIRERAVILDVAGESLFAIVTEPGAEAAPARGPRAGVVFLTRPRAHRNRMWVDAARAVASRGVTAIRFDYHGEGDSTGASHYLNPEQPYGADAAAALQHLVDACGVERAGILGSCFDGRTALAAAGASPHCAALVFMSAPALDESGEMERLVRERGVAHYWRRLRQPDAWRALVSPERLGIALRIISTRIRRRVGASASGATATNGGAAASGAAPPAIRPSPAFVRDLRALVARRTPALFLYGNADAYYPGFQSVIDRELPRLSAEERARFEFVVLEGEAHGYLSIPMQKNIVAHATQWLEKTLTSEGSR